ncbi:MAG: restriction endonuclease [Thermodesulfobacteriota bacterium]
MIKGSLFTEDFLIDGIVKYPEWESIVEEELEKFKEELDNIFSKFPTDGNPIEATTENDLIEPILKELGWDSFLTQQTTAKKGRADVPDYLLFENEDSKNKANKEKDQYKRYLHGTAILEAKAWNVRLDRKGNQPMEGVPSNQIIRYLTSVDTQSNGNVRWGILTNGRLWRIYYNRAQSRSEDYLEIDLPLALGLPGFQTDLFSSINLEEQDWVKVFYLLFRKEAFLQKRDQKTFHKIALERGHYWESKVAEDLSEIVFEEVFPSLLNALKDNDPEVPVNPNDIYLDELRENALTLLYRLLFILYAEDRNLLPVYDKKYDDYGFRKRVREDIERRMEEKDTFSNSLDNYYHHTLNLFKLIDKGEERIGVPPYNGGLFDSNKHSLLNRVKIPDSTFAPLIYKLSHIDDNGVMKWINYRDLSVQQLGSIYERLLEFYPKIDEDGSLSVQPNIFARKTSGSYYTPESLVGLIIERAVGTLLQEIRDNFTDKIKEIKKSKDKKRNNSLAKQHDPATKMLDLKICDPAMGSGHFLVSLVDYLADNILEAIDESETEGFIPWADENNPYISSVSERIESIRSLITQQAQEHGWSIQDDQLDDKQIVRRMILKRCIYGVDKNPMAVELAKVSLWLHTFTVGAPLSFLDHHLRCGDSLFGEWVGTVWNEIRKRGSLLAFDVITKAENAVSGMNIIEDLTDADISEVQTSSSTFKQVEQTTKPLNDFLQLYQAFRWLASTSEEKIVFDSWVLGYYGNPFKIADGTLEVNTEREQVKIFQELLTKARDLIEEERFLNWEVSFPGVWRHWERQEPEGGFDAVIGNPPWDRIKIEPVEWFASRKPEVSLAPNSASRKQMIKELEKQADQLWYLYEKADRRSKTAMVRARKDGQYPLLSGGDINLYALFVERAHRLVNPEGIVGLLTPSGIASNKYSSDFFRIIATEGRLSSLFDFENKKVFFPDIDSRFKFCTYIAGGDSKTFDHIDMAFFLHNVSELDELEKIITLTAKDFARVNPNTGTAPIFRTKRDAEITVSIYEKFPVLNNHSKDKIWKLKYMRMFDMANDSGLFKTLDQLESEGFYPVNGNKLKKGNVLYLPLYVGKSISQYDHRASSINVNPNNLKVTASSRNTTLDEHKDPNFYIEPQYYVDESEVNEKIDLEWAIAFRDITNTTNERTFISTIVPKYACNHKLPLLIPEEGSEIEFKLNAFLILSNLASFMFDYVTRQKIQATNMTWYSVEQLPVIQPEMFEQKLGKRTIAEFIKEHVLHLTYTAWDMQPFAKDMGYDGDPFIWHEEDRRHRMAKLDALFFNLYEINEDDADYILSTFPIVKRRDEEKHDCYLTRDLILAYMRALKAGDTEVIVSV